MSVVQLWSDLVHVATTIIQSKDWLGLTDCLIQLWSDLVHVATKAIESKAWIRCLDELVVCIPDILDRVDPTTSVK